MRLSQRRRGVTRSAVFLGVGWCLAGLLLVQAAAAVAPVYSGVELARALPKVPAACRSTASPRTIRPCRSTGGARCRSWLIAASSISVSTRDPGAEEPDMDRFIDRWRGEPDAYAVMDRKTFAELGERGVPMREIARDTNRVLVSRR